MQNVVGILPNRFGHHDGEIRIHIRKHRHAFFLGANKPVFLVRFIRMNAFEFEPGGGDRVRKFFFHAGLGGPAGLVGGKA